MQQLARHRPVHQLHTVPSGFVASFQSEISRVHTPLQWKTRAGGIVSCEDVPHEHRLHLPTAAFAGSQALIIAERRQLPVSTNGAATRT